MRPECKVFVHPLFWKDTKTLRKNCKKSFLDSAYSDDDFEQADGSKKLKSIAYFDTINNYINNNRLEEISEKVGRQPYLDKGWTIHKIRYGIDTTGKRGGVRLIFAVNDRNLLYISVRLKKDVEGLESKFEAECVERLGEYINIM
jgi:hypothetical protein